MASKVTTLFEDSAKQNALYPRTKVSAISDNSSNSLEQLLDAKQAALVSGTNIKTVNGGSVVGSGDLPVFSGIDTNNVIASGNSKVDYTATQDCFFSVTGAYSTTAQWCIGDANGIVAYVPTDYRGFGFTVPLKAGQRFFKVETASASYKVYGLKR